MTHFNYIFQHMRQSMLVTAIKVLSIGLGLAMSGLLFVRVAYDNSIDSCFGDTDHLYQIWEEFEINDKKLGASQMCVGAIAGGILNGIPEYIEASAIQRPYSVMLKNGETVIEGSGIIADSLFCRTMGVDVIEGNPLGLAMPGNIYISDKIADKYFGGESPLGKTLFYGDQGAQLNIAGVYRGWGDETTIRADYAISMPTVVPSEQFTGWRGGDSWFTYIRVKPGTDLETLNAKIKQIIKANAPDTESSKLEAWAAPLRDTYRNYSSVRQITITLSILGAGILIVTALNYVLLSISALPRRSKAIGVLKCAGATSQSVFRMFLLETLIIVVMGVVVAVLCIHFCKLWAQDSIYDYFVEYINMDRLWVIVAVVTLTFLLAATIPAVTFSRISVQQVFKRFSGRQHAWKHTLLFIEFAGVALVSGILTIVSAQYDCLVNTPLGYNPDGAIIVSFHGNSKEECDAVMDSYSRLPYVEGVAASSYYPTYGYSGAFVRDNEGNLKFSTRYDDWSPNYADVMGMTVKEGRIPAPASEELLEVIVNEEFVRQMGWRESDAIGKTFNYDYGTATVTGVIRDFLCDNYYNPQKPFVALTTLNALSWLTLRISEPTDANEIRLIKEILKLYPAENIRVINLRKRYDSFYVDVKLFRTMVSIAAVIMIFICAIGLTGYLTDEMRRRSREIAIRKVNGASTGSIIDLITRSILIVALPSVTLGTLLAIYFGRQWLDQFSMTIDGITARFILAGLLTLIFIVVLAVIFTRMRANDNPTESLRAE